MIVLGEMLVHPGTGRVRMDLHEKLTDHFAAQSLAYGCNLARSPGSAALAGQPRFQTNPGINVVAGHVGMIMP